MRPPISLRINGDLLRRIIRDRTTIESLAKEAGTTRQTVHAWFSRERISPKHLSALVRIIGLSADELKALDRSRITVEERLVIRNREYKQMLEKIRDQVDELLNRLES